jgi:hypothetical protein
MKMRAKPSLVLLVLLLVAIPMAADPEVNCEVGAANTPTCFSGYGWVCAGYGLGCTRCVDAATNRSCIRNGNNPCVPTLEPPAP